MRAITNNPEKLRMIVATLEEQLAAAQARDAKLREALKSFEGEYGWTACHDEALSTPTDDTALRQYVAKELRKMGVKLWRRADELENGK